MLLSEKTSNQLTNLLTLLQNNSKSLELLQENFK